jgi:glyoxylase-like metal-dependent hydrolase (beta-lactamase superfamily II)/8-oxo-dGTP pyrophosphatase MutT (NUDIX family)
VADLKQLRPSATIVIVRESGEGMQILLLGRTPEAAHFAGAYVFPGGTLEPGDDDRELWQRVLGLSAAAADQRLNLPQGALAYWIAAARECFEEAGILLACDARGRFLDGQQVALLGAQRAALNARTLTFKQFLLQHDLYIPAEQMAYLAHWVTPPTRPRRFDTRFFLMPAPPGQEAQHDNTEIVGSHWLTAAEALARAERNEFEMVRATRAIVTSLATFPTPQAALVQLRATPYVRANRPCLAQGREGTKLFLNHDAAYAETHWVDPQESGQSTYDMVADVPKRLDRHVVRVLAPNPSYLTGPGTNTYLLDAPGSAGAIVLDPGPADPAHIEAIMAAAGGRVRWIVLTHTHRDHSPGAAALRAASGAPIAGRPARADSEYDDRVPFDRVLADEEVLESGAVALQAIHTPGHASNHLCYLLPQTRMLFTGDHIIQGSTVVISPPDGNMAAYLGSLRRLQSLDLAILAPGHGYLIGEVQHEIARLIAHRLARESKVRGALRQLGGRASLQQLLPRVYDDVPATVHPLAARSLRAHLDKLVGDGELRLDQDGWEMPRGSA